MLSKLGAAMGERWKSGAGGGQASGGDDTRFRWKKREGRARKKDEVGPGRNAPRTYGRQTKGAHSQTSKERQPVVALHWFAQPCTSYEAMLIQFSVGDVTFCAMAGWLKFTRV